MRFVDLNLLQLPPGWSARADQALVELRAEIAAAEAAATAAGADRAAARRAAISAGLDLPARKQIWRDLAPHLAVLRKNKCWYSESLNPGSDKNVDHFRPKNRVDGDANHDGYWWRAFDWKNYRYSSQWCNQRRVDRVNGTSGGKWDLFPLCAGSTRAYLETDDSDLELPELLDPTDPEDCKLLSFRGDGRPTPARAPGTVEYQRAETSIEAYHLDCKELVDDRRNLAGRIQRMVLDLEYLRPLITEPKMRVLYKRREIELLRAIHPDEEYSAAALAYARAEIYTTHLGIQIKRDWLEEILNAQP